MLIIGWFYHGNILHSHIPHRSPVQHNSSSSSSYMFSAGSWRMLRMHATPPCVPAAQCSNKHYTSRWTLCWRGCTHWTLHICWENEACGPTSNARPNPHPPSHPPSPAIIAHRSLVMFQNYARLTLAGAPTIYSDKWYRTFHCYLRHYHGDSFISPAF